MSIKNFNEKQTVKTMDTSEAIAIGSFIPVRGFLANIRLFVYLDSISTFSGDSITLTLYSNEEYSSPLGASTIDISSIENHGENWLGWISFEFNGLSLSANQTYYLRATSTYTRTTGYISFVYDNPPQAYSSSPTFLGYPKRIQVFYKENL